MKRLQERRTMSPAHVMVCLLLVASASAAAEPRKSDEEPLRLSAQEQQALGVVTASVQLQSFEDELRAPGEVRGNAYATVLISPRVPAQVVARHVRLGDRVKTGTPLITLTSVELAEAQGALIVADRDWQRVKQLGVEAVSGRRYLEAQVVRDQALAKVRAFGMTEAQSATLLRAGSTRATGAVDLLAPQAGRVTTDDFLIGERVEPGRVLFTIVDPNIVWIDARLPPQSAARVSVGAQARVADGAHEVVGKVVQRGQSADEATRTVALRIEVANANERLVPGQFVEVGIVVGTRAPTLAIPTDAVTHIQGETVVFKQAADGELAPTLIRAGETHGAWTAVREGLAAGDTIAIKGIYALKARLLKSQIGADDD